MLDVWFDSISTTIIIQTTFETESEQKTSRRSISKRIKRKNYNEDFYYDKVLKFGQETVSESSKNNATNLNIPTQKKRIRLPKNFRKTKCKDVRKPEPNISEKNCENDSGSSEIMVVSEHMPKINSLQHWQKIFCKSSCNIFSIQNSGNFKSDSFFNLYLRMFFVKQVSMKFEIIWNSLF